jgi:hypothetical protein
MPTKTSVGPNEVVRLEVLRLAPPLRREKRAKSEERRAKSEILRIQPSRISMSYLLVHLGVFNRQKVRI